MKLNHDNEVYKYLVEYDEKNNTDYSGRNLGKGIKIGIDFTLAKVSNALLKYCDKDTAEKIISEVENETTGIFEEA